MTQSEVNDKKAGEKISPQQHHRKAAKIHEQASTHHEEAARRHESGDVLAAALHARLAYEYAVQAAEHGHLLDRPSDPSEQDNQSLNDPLQEGSEHEYSETKILNIL